MIFTILQGLQPQKPPLDMQMAETGTVCQESLAILLKLSMVVYGIRPQYVGT